MTTAIKATTIPVTMDIRCCYVISQTLMIICCDRHFFCAFFLVFFNAYTPLPLVWPCRLPAASASNPKLGDL